MLSAQGERESTMEKSLRNKKRDGKKAALSVLVAAIFAVTLFSALTADNSDGHKESGFSEDTSLGAGELGRSMAADLGVKMIEAGFSHTIILKNDGTVWAWGYNSYGQLGDGTTTQRNTPVQVSGLTGVTAISAGYRHSLALKSDGTVWAWGQNDKGQLGDGTTTQRSTPIKVSGSLTGVTAISAGYNHSLALRSNGTVWAWGDNICGQLGDRSQTDRKTPVQAYGLAGVTAIAAGDYHSLALESNGTVWAWGNSESGQLGNGAFVYGTTPMKISGSLTGVTAIAAGGKHSLALKDDGTLWTWGSNTYGQLGDGTTTQRNTPVQVLGSLTGVEAIAAGAQHSLALKGDGTLWTWGSNAYGQLGDGTNTDRSTPVQVSGLTGVTAIAAGDYHSLALKSDGTVWAWGQNGEGQLGDGTNMDRSTPVQVLNEYKPDYLTGVEAIAAGGQHSLALKSDGTVRVWGSNTYGQLGNNTNTSKNTPVQVAGSLNSVTAISAGDSQSFILKSDGTVWAWGLNDKGQLGDNTTTDKKIPAQVSSLTGVKAISAGDSHSLALKSDGTVWAWGQNGEGQLGDGTQTDRITPVQTVGENGIGYLTGVTTIIAENDHSFAIKTDGTLWAWGQNGEGQLGDGTETDRSEPAHIHIFGTWIYDGTEHWRECKCSARADVEEHTFGTSWSHDGKEHWYECKCGLKKDVEAHIFGTEWISDGKEHWYACSCGERISSEEHAYGSWSTDIPASHTSDGSKHRVCAECGYTQMGTISAGHTFDDLRSDGSGHWSVCSCSERTNTEGHTFTEWVTVPPVSHITDGYRDRECSVCGYIDHEVLPAHSFSDWTVDIEAGYLTDGSEHRDCSGCGHTETAVIHAHSFGKWIVDVEAGHLTDGSKHRTCSGCGQTDTAVIYAEGHSFKYLRYDASEHWYECKCSERADVEVHVANAEWMTNGKDHWHACTCGAKVNAEEHVFTDWVTELPIEHVKDGFSQRECPDCGRTEIEILPAHSFGKWVVDAEADHLTDGSQHRDCKGCEYTETVTIPAEGHTFDELISDGSEHCYECSCGAKVDAEEHVYSTEWMSDGKEHWYGCECGERKDAEEHIFSTWTVEPPILHLADGSRQRECSVCGHIEKEIISAHSFDEWTVDNEADHLTEGSEHRDCKGCSYTETVAIPAEGHSFNVLTHDDWEHWHQCACGERTDVHEHVYSTEWMTDGKEHWHGCECGMRKDVQKHVFAGESDDDECGCGITHGEIIIGSEDDSTDADSDNGSGNNVGDGPDVDDGSADEGSAPPITVVVLVTAMIAAIASSFIIVKRE